MTTYIIVSICLGDRKSVIANAESAICNNGYLGQIAEAIIIIIIMLTDYNKVVNLLRQCTTSDVSAAEN